MSNPEFLKQGAAIDDFMKPDRVVIGAEDARAAELMKELYAPFTRTGAPIMNMDCASAELCKYAANAMLATRISFMNEVANVCEAMGADVDQVRRAVAADRRIGPSFLFPGVGYGGSCFPKDVKAMLRFAHSAKYDFQILKSVEAVNEKQKLRLLEKLKAHFGSLKGKRIAVWGLAFKPRTDDMREAPAVPLISGLIDAGATRPRLRSGSDEGRARHLRLESSLRRERLRRANRGGRPRPCHGMERVSRAGLRPHAKTHASAGHFRRPQYLQSGADQGARLQLLLDRPSLVMPKSVLVIGGAGYIGSHVVKALRARGDDVVVYDDLSAGHRTAARFATSLVEGNIHDVERLRNALRQYDADAVMHFAAWASVGDSVRDPIGYYRNNVTGTLTVLEAMAAEHVPFFVFSSTAAVFGNPIETPIKEDHPKKPINSYGETKVAVERALPHFERAYEIRSSVLRYFNAAGADPDGELGEDHTPELHLIPRALDAAAGRGTFQIFGDDYPTPDGTCLRDYIHVTDLAEAHLLALDGLRGGADSSHYNLGNGKPTSVREVVDTVGRVVGTPVPLTIAPRREGDPAVLFASSDRIKSELGWRPRFEDVETIVSTAWRWRQAHPSGYGHGARG